MKKEQKEVRVKEERNDYIYIYIYRERERERERNIILFDTRIYIYIKYILFVITCEL